MQDRYSELTRRRFMQTTAAVSAGLAMNTVGAVDMASAADPAAIRKTRSYNPQMEYRRLGKTGLWVSAVCLGGHWKRVDKVIGTQSKFAGCEDMGDPSAAEEAIWGIWIQLVVHQCLGLISVSLWVCRFDHSETVVFQGFSGSTAGTHKGKCPGMHTSATTRFPRHG